MNSSYLKFIIFIFVLNVLACNKEDQAPFALISGFSSADIGNNGTSEDIYIALSIDNNLLDDLRVIIIPENEVGNFDIEEANDLDDSRYSSISVNGKTDFTTKLIDINDINGDKIELDKTYILKILLVKEGKIQISDKSSEIILTDIHLLIGDYIGTWDDNFYTNFAVSARILSEANKVLRGELFYTGNFTPCCNAASVGAENDGKITLVLSEDEKTISSFTYDQVLLTYMGGCNGQYTGTGEIDDFSFEIDYTGSDCDGFHIGGKLRIEKKLF